MRFFSWENLSLNAQILNKNIHYKIIRVVWQLKYLINNWIYSTNHKRISINYFWFVLLAGIVGMVLATIIRIEMAYPGVGILAGDNSQYLSIATAHGVVMVFFMAMPLLFGFFTNFLLPTQLGVRDVAFPRMNSAAFWFLPGSLIVLCQMVCVDRRYQRMNCFNLRELQTLVRKKFFFDVMQNQDSRLNLDNSVLGLKNKLNSEVNLNNFFLNSKYGLLKNSNKNILENDNLNFTNELSNQTNLINQSLTDNVMESKRYIQSEYPSMTYKVKGGDYLPENPILTNYGFLLNTINYKTISNRKDFWMFSSEINSTLKNNFNFIKNWNFNSTQLSEKNEVYANHMGVFDYFNILNEKNFINTRLLSLNYLDQKFVNLFFSQNKQQLALNNWKNLKLQREGWRCRMLLSRNQNSLYRKYINENDLIWVVEKNAKDLLPGWAMITPFSSRTRYTLIGKTDLGLVVLLFTLLASIVSCSNFVITYRYLSTLNNRKMRDARSFFSETILATSWMTLGANPMLFLGLFFLVCDRHWKTSFFDYSGGGDAVLFQHMFWFFGHPEVYIIIVPCFGLINTMLSFYLRKRISARASLMYSVYTIAFLGFFVWGHHMYMVGLAHTTRMLYSTLTVMISIPAATKIMHWLVTFINSSLHMELPVLFIISFIFFFLSGGISGMSVAHTGMNIIFHDTLFLIGHFHVMLAGSLMFAGFGACYFYLPAIFGVKYNRFFAYLHFIYYTVGQLFTVVTMMWLGYAGMPRRVLDYPAALGGWHSICTSAHMLSVAGILCFIIVLFESIRKRRSYVIYTFGIGRYNTRLNFYLYEVSRNKYWLSKSSTLLNHNSTSKNKLNLNLREFENNLFFYYIKK